MPSVKMSIIERDSGLARFFATTKALKNGAHVKVGVLEGSAKGSEKRDGGLSNAELAAVHEFGTADGRIPERSFLRSTFGANHAKYIENLKTLIVKIVEGQMSLEQAFNILGARIASDIQKRITAGDPIPPPNTPETIARKVNKGKWNKRKKNGGLNDFAGTVRTLVDTGRMVASITWAYFASAVSETK